MRLMKIPIDVADGRIDGYDASTYFTREVGLPVLFLVPYGAWRLVVRGDHSWDAILLVAGPIISWISVMFYCVAIRAVRPLPSVVPKATPLLAWPFLIYLFAYKGVWGFSEIFQEWSVAGILGAFFYTWLGYGPLKALSILQREDVVEALRQSGRIVKGLRNA